MNYLGRMRKQLELFSPETIKKMLKIKISIIGLGGNGSALAVLTALAGFLWFYLFDSDKLELSNLNRFMCGGIRDIDEKKVTLVGRYIKKLDPGIEVLEIPYDVRTKSFRPALDASHVIFSAPDNNETRVFLQEYCIEKKKPLLDIGSGCRIESGKLKLFGSRCSLYIPGGACLFCQTLDEGEPDLSDVSFVVPNVLAAAQGLQLYFAWLSGKPLKANLIVNDCLTFTTTPMLIVPRPDCPYCGKGKAAFNEGSKLCTN